MAETTIGWTATWSEKHQRFFDGFTFNGWWGCTKVDEECANCYAEAFDHRLGGHHWGKGKPRRQFPDAHWLQPYKWARKARQLGVRLKVFCASMSDLFDVDAPPGALERLWRLIEGTPELDWLLLTKRPIRARSLLPWMAGGIIGEPWPNVWIGTSAGRQESMDTRGYELITIPARVRFLSCEPMLERVVATRLFDSSLIHWLIIGGESGARSRGFLIDAARDLLTDAQRFGVKVYVKQLGEVPIGSDAGGAPLVRIRGNKREDMAEWPADLRVREWPAAA